jgi:tetratricopeptide (TPR) repeat protein
MEPGSVGNGGAWEQSVTGGCNRGRLRQSIALVATTSSCLPFIFLLLLGTAGELRADSREALQKAVALVQQGRLEEADRQVRLALSDPATHAVACSVLGAIRFQQKRLPESVSLLQEAIRLEPRLLGAHLTLAQVYTLQGKTDLVLGLSRRILELDPSNAPARLALARAETDRGNYKRSLELVQQSSRQLGKGLDKSP